MTRSPALSRTIGVDLLRGIAILAVAAYHVFLFTQGNVLGWQGWSRTFGTTEHPLAVWLYPLTWGWAGVSLFFVLSGFCIHYSTLRSGSFQARRFFWRRFWRLYPAYLIALVYFSRGAHLAPTTPEGALQLGTHALFLHNLSADTFFTINPSFWSIATEVQLYLLYPLLLLLRTRVGMEKSLIVVLALGGISRLIALAVVGLPEHHIAAAWSFPVITWFDWCLGALVAERFHAGQRTVSQPGRWLIALVPLFILSTLYRPLTIFCFTLAALIAAVVLDLSLHRPWRASLPVRLVAFLGTISYSLYLWHQPLLYPLQKHLGPYLHSSFLLWTCAAGVVLLLATVSYVLLERPGIQLGQWLARRRTAAR